MSTETSTHIGFPIMPQHHAIVHIVWIRYPLQRAEILLPLLEEVFDGQSLIGTPVIWAVSLGLAALWTLLLDEICDRTFDCGLSKPKIQDVKMQRRAD